MVSGPRTVPATHLYRRLEDLHARIARRAQGLARERGASEGFGVDDWFRAEAEILRDVSPSCTELEDEIRISVDLPGVAPEDVEIGFGALELVIGVRGRFQALEVVELPREVDAARAITSVTSGVLTVLIPRRQPGAAKRSA
jgi:HSP20 family molecular chaperone IbpA